MTDEAKALAKRLRGGRNGWTTLTEIEAADLIETQAREIERLGVIAQGNANIVCKILDEKDAEIERLREALGAALNIIDRAYRKYGTEFDAEDTAKAIAARAALAGDSHE